MPPTIEPGTIYLLRADLDAPPVAFDEIVAATTPVEHARAARFVHEADRRRHLIGRGLVRLFLARTLPFAPADVPILVSDLGRPYVDNGPSFNISHSGPLILVAIAADGRVGVDVEAVRPIRDLPRLARTTFVEQEVEAVLRFEPEHRLLPFFRTWSRKEAILKALGLGLTALSDITVSCDADCANALLRLDRPDESRHSWCIRPLHLGGEVEAAIAWDRPIGGIQTVDW